MSRLEKLSNAKSLRDIAEILGFKPSALSYILYQTPEELKYKTFSIAKKSGGKRVIKAPNKKLKKLQRRLAALLYDCMEELLPDQEKLVKDNSPQSSHRSNYAISHGFKKGLSIASNAALHKKKRYVLNLDIEDFFPSLNFGRVRGYFIKNKNFKLDPKAATVLANIACHDNSLPQGSPCSPVISNLIGQVLDVRLVRLAKKHKCTYSRYADDLTFSTNRKTFPKELAHKKSKNKCDWIIGKELSDHIKNAGFTINVKKTRMQYKDARQVVTGLVVNKVVNTKNEYYRYARVMCQSLFMTGEFHLPPSKEQKPKLKNNKFSALVLKIKNKILSCIIENKENNESVDSSEEDERTTDSPSTKQLEGILNHIYYVKNYRNKFAQEGYRKSRHDGYIKPKHDTDTPEYPPLNRCNQYSDKSHQMAIDGIKNLYAKFLFFKNFYFLDKPVIFCEGKTDITYFECAIRQLLNDYPNLIKKEDDKLKFKISFFNKTETVSEMLKMAEGSSGMKYIMLSYERRMKKYACEGKKHPVIMIADNDKAGRDLIKAAKKFTQNINSPFIHVTENLYIIPLPKVNGQDTEPENYFETAVLKEKLEGKSFNRTDDNVGNKNQYGKAAFAKNVIKRKQNSINFDNFKPVLDLINEVISDYHTKIESEVTPKS